MIIGVDPGLNGAIAYYTPTRLEVVPIPTFEIQRGGKNKRDVDARQLAAFLRPYKLEHVFLENVHSMPQQGVSSVFQFGKTFGIIIGIIAAIGISYTFVEPRVWKKAMNVPASKDAARARASQLLPLYASKWKLVKDDGKAEAALIALYGHQQQYPQR